MSNVKPSDREAFESLIRSGRRTNRIEWVPVPGQDDRDSLNRALRRAAGRDAPEPGEEPQSHPWKSISALEDES
jgi:hypothetical protein